MWTNGILVSVLSAYLSECRACLNNLSKNETSKCYQELCRLCSCSSGTYWATIAGVHGDYGLRLALLDSKGLHWTLQHNPRTYGTCFLTCWIKQHCHSVHLLLILHKHKKLTRSKFTCQSLVVINEWHACVDFMWARMHFSHSSPPLSENHVVTMSRERWGLPCAFAWVLRSPRTRSREHECAGQP